MNNTIITPEMIKELKDVLKALVNSRGNHLTDNRPFEDMMIEEKINRLAEIVTVLLAIKIKEFEQQV